MNSRMYIALIVLLVGYILFLQQCQQPEIEYVQGEPVVVTDTLRLPPDTVVVEGPVQYIHIPVPQPVPEGDALTYTQMISDDYLSGSLYAKVKGTLLDWNFQYTPKLHTITKPVYITRTTIIPVQAKHKSSTYLLLGGGLYGNIETQSLELKAGIDRKQYVYVGSYDPILKVYGFSVMRKLSF